MGKDAKHMVRLDRAEREELERILATPRAAAERVLRARVLLKADEGAEGPAWSDTAIADAFEISVSKVQRLRQRLVDEGLRRDARAAPESASPGAQARWGAGGAVGDAGVQRAPDRPGALDAAAVGRPARRTRGRGLDQRRDGAADAQKNDLKPWRERQWVIPPEQSAEFVCAMEDVLEVYQRPYDPTPPGRVPGRSVQATGEGDARPAGRWPRAGRAPSTTSTSATARRICSCSSSRWRAGGTSRSPTRRTALDYAQSSAIWSTSAIPTATRSCWCRTTSTRTSRRPCMRPSRPTEARRLLAKLEIHYTPKHGSWLNMAETELSILSRQCLRPADRRGVHTRHRDRRLGSGAQPRQEQGALALHDGRRPHQTPALVSRHRTRQLCGGGALVHHRDRVIVTHGRPTWHGRRMVVVLTAKQRRELERLARGAEAGQVVRRAHVVLWSARTRRSRGGYLSAEAVSVTEGRRAGKRAGQRG